MPLKPSNVTKSLKIEQAFHKLMIVMMMMIIIISIIPKAIRKQDRGGEWGVYKTRENIARTFSG
jgi:hypothetical protein